MNAFPVAATYSLMTEIPDAFTPVVGPVTSAHHKCLRILRDSEQAKAFQSALDSKVAELMQSAQSSCPWAVPDRLRLLKQCYWEVATAVLLSSSDTSSKDASVHGDVSTTGSSSKQESLLKPSKGFSDVSALTSTESLLQQAPRKDGLEQPMMNQPLMNMLQSDRVMHDVFATLLAVSAERRCRLSKS